MKIRKRIVVDVRSDGTMAAGTQGVVGPPCLDEVSRIEVLCGEPISSSELTDDYHRDATSESANLQAEILEENT